MTDMGNPATQSTASETSSRRFYHGTRADMKPGDLIQPGYSSNYAERKSPWVYFSETLHAATWGAELAKGERPGRIYVVEPTGAFMDDPNLTDKKFPGNPTKSYRSREPLLEDILRHRQGREDIRPPGVERQVRRDLRGLPLCQSVVHRPVQVIRQLRRLSRRD